LFSHHFILPFPNVSHKKLVFSCRATISCERGQSAWLSYDPLRL